MNHTDNTLGLPILGIQNYIKGRLDEAPRTEMKFRKWLEENQSRHPSRFWERLSKPGAFRVCALTDIKDLWHFQVAPVHQVALAKVRTGPCDLDDEERILHIEKGIYLHCDSMGISMHNIYHGIAEMFNEAAPLKPRELIPWQRQIQLDNP